MVGKSHACQIFFSSPKAPNYSLSCCSILQPTLSRDDFQRMKNEHPGDISSIYKYLPTTLSAQLVNYAGRYI